MRLFSTAEVAQILSLSESRIRSFVRAGLVVPKRNEKKTLQFNFHDLLFLKTAKTLLASRIPRKTIARRLTSLKKSLPKKQPLTSLKIYADGQRLVVWDGKSRYQPDSGQFLFDFDPRTVLRTLKLAPRTVERARRTAAEWFDYGTTLEDRSISEALQAYTKALEIDPSLNAARINLARLYHEAGNFRESEEQYRTAAASDLQDATPLFNLGVLLEDMKRPLAAVRAYEEALERDPDFADAHYNLGLLLDSLGQKKAAFAHLRMARHLYLGKK